MLKLFPDLKREVLQEYAADSALEDYTSIVLDKDDNAFKVVTGKFHDKRDAYEKLKDRGLITRKTFESRIWDWIENNAPNNLTAYLMFSTAFSKWKGNNILNDYYVKLLNDIPKLNREKEKGDPNTMGGYQKTEESTENLQEVSPDKLHYEPSTDPNLEKVKDRYDVLRDVRVRPLNQDGSVSKYAGPLSLGQTGEEKPYKQVLARKQGNGYTITDVNFLRDLYEKAFIQHMGQAYPKWACYPEYLIIDDTERPVAKITRAELPQLFEKAVNTQEKDLKSINNKDLPSDNDTIQTIKQTLAKARLHNNTAMANRMKSLLNNTIKLNKKEPRSPLDAANLEALKATHKELAGLQSFGLGQGGNADPKAAAQAITDITANVDKTLEASNEFSKISDDYKDLQSTKDYLKYVSNTVSSFDNLLATNTRNQIIEMIKDIQKRVAAIRERGIPSKDIRPAELNILSQTPEERKQREQDFYSNPSNAPKNPIHGGDTLDSFVSKLDKRNTKNINDTEDAYDKVKANDTRVRKIKDLERQKEYYSDQLNKTGSNSIRLALAKTLKELEDEIAKLNDEKEPTEEATVNDGATMTYQEQPKQPVMNKSAMVPVSGTVVEGADKLNPELFEGDKLKPEIRAALLKIAAKFKEKLGLELDPVDVYFTGSNANYNYNSASDIDLHLVYNYEEVGAAAEIFKKYLFAQKKVFNSEYDIYVKGIKVEVGTEDINTPLVSTGVYSLISDDWKVKPEPKTDMPEELPPYINEVINEIEQAIESHDSEIIGNLWKAMGELRKASLADEGEFGAGNLMFKKLRADGYLDRLKQAYYDSASQELSLESLEEI